MHFDCIMSSIIENALIVFTDRRLFWVIAPGIPLLTECESEQFYCNQTIFVPNDVFFFESFMFQNTCLITNMTSSFGIECIPG